MICNQRARTLEHTAVFRQLARLRVSETVVLRAARFEISCCVLIFLYDKCLFKGLTRTKPLKAQTSFCF